MGCRFNEFSRIFFLSFEGSISVDSLNRCINHQPKRKYQTIGIESSTVHGLLFGVPKSHPIIITKIIVEIPKQKYLTF